MSMKLMVKAMETKVGNPLRKLVLIKLADNANDKGECWPSYQHIADQCEISRRSVINHIAALEEMGFLVKETRTGTHKPNASNLYHLNLDGESPAPRGESPALGGGESPAPRTSHSLEPINEPTPLTPKGESSPGGENPRTSKAGAERVMNLYNTLADGTLPKAMSMTPKRQRQIDQVCRIKMASGKQPFADYNEQAWGAYFQLLLANPWNCGENQRGWKANFDYAIRTDVVLKTLEREYA